MSDGVKITASVTASTTDVAQAQLLIEWADREVRRIARKAGVPDAAMDRALRDFAAHLLPHAGREASIHRPSYYRRWWQGYAAGMRAAR